MRLFTNNLARHASHPAIITQLGQTLTYAQLDQRVQTTAQQLQANTGLILIEMANTLEPLITYLAALHAKRPALLIAQDSPAIDNLIEQYQPTSHFSFQNNAWQLTHLDQPNPTTPHPDLALLLPTSGSTGAAKLVRLSAQNIQANANAISQFLNLTPADRAITSLPSHYSYGLSIIHSHLTVGATLLLTDQSLTEPTFWDFFKQHNATSLAGVPYTFELLDSINFQNLNLPSLRYLTQAGGRLEPQAIQHYANLAQQKNFELFIMYGQTEATARIAYIPPKQLLQNTHAIGQPIPNGALHLIDQDGHTITTPNQTGELVYTGPNVMMGYAKSLQDLALPPQTTSLHTGDLAQQQSNGLFKIVGRKSRFLKIFGLRIALDEVEQFLAKQNIQAACTGNDQTLFIATEQNSPTLDIQSAISRWTKLPAHTIRTKHYTQIPRLPSGKTDYQTIVKNIPPPSSQSPPQTPSDANSIAHLFTHHLGIEDIQPNDTFTSLGGDSLTYVQVSVALEERLGRAPAQWQNLTVQQLQALTPKHTRIKHTELSVLFRALAILSVVGTHFNVHDLHGGAYLLLALAGMSFARFQAVSAYNHATIKPIIKSSLRILLPTAAFIIFLQIIRQDYDTSFTLMYSNWINPKIHEHFAPWFIQLLLQIFAFTAILFASPRIRNFAHHTPYRFALTLLAITYTARILGPTLWDTTHLYNRIPHMLAWIFALGWCLQTAQNTQQKLINSALILLLATPIAITDEGMRTFIIGALALTWLTHIPTIWPFNYILGLLGAASLYIYLTHFLAQGLLIKLTPYHPPILQLIAALITGIATWYLAEKAMTLTAQFVRRIKH